MYYVDEKGEIWKRANSYIYKMKYNGYQEYMNYHLLFDPYKHNLTPISENQAKAIIKLNYVRD